MVYDEDGFQKYSKHYRRKTKSFSSNYQKNYTNSNVITSSTLHFKNNDSNQNKCKFTFNNFKNNNNNNKTHFECNNCGKYGHSFNHCKFPIISYGLIVLRYDRFKKNFQYLMIRRKDSYGYIDFIRGKYSPQNIRQLKQIIAQMSITEKEKLLNEPFRFLWQQMCGRNDASEELVAERKYTRIVNGIQHEKEWITLKSLIQNCTNNWTETEWEFPKGRRNSNEKELECALREFEEETGILKNNVCVIENLLPFEETFIGTNYKSYKHKYFLAYLPDEKQNDTTKERKTDRIMELLKTKKELETELETEVETEIETEIETELEKETEKQLSSRLMNFQKSEVSKIEWKTFDESLSAIRPYNVEKRHLLTSIHFILTNFSCFH